jgi:hypothetical protein
VHGRGGGELRALYRSLFRDAQSRLDLAGGFGAAGEPAARFLLRSALEKYLALRGLNTKSPADDSRC